MTETCSEEEDWDPSWGPGDDTSEQTTKAPATEAPGGSAGNIIGSLFLLVLVVTV